MIWFPFILVGGAIAYGLFKTSNKEEESKKKKTKADFNYKKSDLPSKIRFWDDLEGAEKSGEWKTGLMPDKFRHYEKFNDKTNKYDRIDYWEWNYIKMWGVVPDKNQYYFIHKKPRGKEGKYFVSYFTDPPKPHTYYTSKLNK